MRLTIDKKRFGEAVSILQRIKPARTFQTADEYVRLETKEGKLTVSASAGGSVFLKAEIPADGDKVLTIEKEGTADVYQTNLRDMLAVLPDGPVTLSLTGDDKMSLEVSWASGKARIPAFAEDFVTDPLGEVEASCGGTIDGNVLRSAMKSVAYAICNNELHPALQSIAFDFIDGKANIITTDNARLALSEVKREGSENGMILVPASLIKAVTDILSASEGDARICGNASKCCIEAGGYTLKYTAIPGKFPKYLSVIPKDNKNILNVAAKDLLQAVKMTSVTTNQTNRFVKVGLKSDLVGAVLTMTGQDLMAKSTTKTTLDVDYKGEDMEIGFRPEHLTDILAPAGGKMVKFLIKDYRSAVLVKNEEDENIGVILPVLVA